MVEPIAEEAPAGEKTDFFDEFDAAFGGDEKVVPATSYTENRLPVEAPKTV